MIATARPHRPRLIRRRDLERFRQSIASCFRTQATCNTRYNKYLDTPGTAQFQPIWRFWNWDSRHAECLLPEGSMRPRLKLGSRQTLRTVTDRHSLLMRIMLRPKERRLDG